MFKWGTVLAAALLVSGSYAVMRAQSSQASPQMSFFITSVGSGNGANLGGLAGADAHCAALAKAVGAGNRQWRAYLSTTPSGTEKGVNARDRIGKGPWSNAKGVQIAASVEELHSDKNNLTKETQLTEKGEVVNGRGDKPNKHDILTGSNPDGTASQFTCNNWTSAAADGSAMLGHHDRQGGGTNPTSWNAAHQSKGCSQENLRATGGDGLFYCFAVK